MRIAVVRTLTSALLASLALGGPVSEPSVPPAGAGAAGAVLSAGGRAADPVPAGTPDVLVTDQASKRLLLLDGARREWDAADPSAVRWAFSPVGDARYADLEPGISWVHPNEAKRRVHRGRTYVLTTASYGFAAVVAHPSGERYWGDTLSRGTTRHNPHSIELLPDGNVAVAASTGDVVRLYAASRGTVDVPFATYALEDAHGLQWDAGRGVLWALGGDRLVALKAGGTAAAPALTKDFEVPLPTPHGHDLGQVAADPDRLWVSSGSAVYQYVKSSGTFVQDFAGAAVISRPAVKAVGDDPRTGQVASTVPESGLGETWWTRRVTVHRPGGSYRLVDGGLYKARWWLPGR
ncbi:DUF6528 family protein [Streptomyces sp. SP18CS02]|uniref:DUF6528 family protein n=1 Tax=Streptomyces sp. SP18CS02 TaxID=3002531 RepID=UPI002E780C11|nr:DUF6528 family protein [Streptomyces sp. SP18CS02]MEE1755846.1 DUF6528 family protein [Streptomyces sp. SP18CS02]